jgi:multisubunit Na+/H+ antiporter MnhF subunit
MWLIAALVLLAGAVGPAVVVGVYGAPDQRLVGLLQAGATTVLFLVVFARAMDRTDYLIVPVALALVSFAGSLVFARLLVPRK